MLTFSATNDLRELDRLLRELETCCEQNNVGAAVAGRLNLVAEELFVNFSTHAVPTDGVPPRFELTVRRSGDGVECVVRDNMAPFDPRVEGGAPVDGDAQERPVGGLGLRLIRRLATHMDYESTEGNNTTTILLD